MIQLRQLARDGAILATVDGFGRGAVFLVLLLAARELGPSQFGQLSAILAVTMALGSVDLGVATWLLRELLAKPEDVAESLIQSSLSLSVAVAVVTMLAGVILSLAAFSQLELVFVAVGATAYATSLSLGNVLFATDRRSRRYGRIFVGSLLEKSVLVALAAPAALTHQIGLFGLAYLLAAIARLTFVTYVYRRLCPWRALVNLRPRSALNTIRQSLPFGLNSILISVVGRLDILVVVLLAGDIAAGYFSLGDKLVALGLAFGGILSAAALPILGSPLTPIAESRIFAQRVAFAVGLAAAVAVAILNVAGWPVLEAVFGQAYAASRTSVSVMLWAIPISYAAAMLIPVAYLLGRERDLLTANGAASAFGLLAVGIGAAQFGPAGAAAGFVVRQVAILAVVSGLVGRMSPRRNDTVPST